jgi:hypothetical protein
MKGSKIKIALLVIASVLLTLPLVLSFTRLNRVIPLKGDVQLTQKPEINGKTWFDGSFQGQFEKYVNDNIGFRPWFVRVRNQITYSLYGKLNAAYVIRGKEDYFYEINYIKAYNGTDFIGKDTIVERAVQIKLLQDSLQKIDKTLIICIAPGKGSFYPEYFPDEYIIPHTDLTNYHLYKTTFDSLGVNCIDYNGWFKAMKDTSRYILYPKYGIHWSHYGMLLATDSLISLIENKRQIDLPDLKLTNFKLSKQLNNSDYDIADGLNLVFKLPIDPLCYPEISWEDTTSKTQPKVIVIADSFYWSMFGTEIWYKSFSPGGFWYYNKQIYPESFSQELLVENINQKEAIDANDVFVIMVNEANLPLFPWGAVASLQGTFEPGYENSIEQKKVEAFKEKLEIERNISIMKADENWMKDIKQKAEKNGISVDSMLYLDAKWLIETKKEQNN